MAYTIETVIAEKFQTIIVRGLLNTRLKDFYDIYILVNTKFKEINKDSLIKAIKNTFKRRKTTYNIDFFNDVINELVNDDNIHLLWNNYILKNSYAKNIKFEDTIKALQKIIIILN